jgi:hypothetical protein
MNVNVLGPVSWLLIIYLSGNEFMRSNQHLKAVELYTCAIALNKKNAIYYCNRYGPIGETMAVNSRAANYYDSFFSHDNVLNW